MSNSTPFRVPGTYAGFSPVIDFGTKDKPTTEVEQLKAELDFARSRVQQLQQGQPTAFAAVLAKDGARVSLLVGTEVLELEAPHGMPVVEPGDMIRIMQRQVPGGMQLNIVGKVDEPPTVGPIGTVRQIHGKRAEVEIQGAGSKLVPVRGGCKVGDRVVLDAGGNVGIINLGGGDSSRVFTEPTGVEWDDIGGNEEAKAALREAIEYPAQHPEVFTRFGIKPAKGAMLYGPPGCGKTMLAKAAATALARVHGASGAGGYIYVKGPELVSKWAGETENNIRRVFEQARAFKARTGIPAILFFDEGDALFGRRGTGGTGRDGLQAMVVPALLAEMDGLSDAGAFVLIATNRPDALDSAVVREGRIDKKIQVRRPTQPEVAAIVARALRGKPCEASGEVMGSKAAESLFSAKRALYTLTMKGEGDRKLVLGNVASGAMAVAIADRAVAAAMRGALGGDVGRNVTAADLEQAIDEIQAEQQSLDHSDDLRELAEGGTMTGAEDLRRGKVNKGERRIVLLEDIAKTRH